MTHGPDSTLDPRSSPARDSRSNRGTLQFIARQAMIDHGLEPEFSPAALDQARTAEPARGDGAGVRDLRGLLWSSIDNDDSMDLDQLTVSLPAAAGATRIALALPESLSRPMRNTGSDSSRRPRNSSVRTSPIPRCVSPTAAWLAPLATSERGASRAI